MNRFTAFRVWLRSCGNKLALYAVISLSTADAVWLFLVWSLLPLAIPTWQQFVFYVSGGILQLVLLPLIMVGQKLQGETAELRAQQDHEAIMGEVATLAMMQRELQETIDLLHKLVATQASSK